MFFSEMAQSSPNASIVQKYSIMYHVLQQRESSLRREPAQPQNGEKNIHLTGVGGIIADKFGTQLNDGSSRVKAASATDTKFVHDFIDKFETANMLLSEEPLIGIN